MPILLAGNHRVKHSEDGKHFEATGVPADIRVPVFPQQDFERERDTALEKALEVLSKDYH
jgi:C-terminal processing protease CtpA/Prc